MGVLYQVNGPAVVWVAGGAVGASRVPLGICRDRIRIRVNFYENPIKSDNAGMHMPADVQDMGKDATISCTLSQVDPAVLAAISAQGDAAGPGLIGSVGLPIASAGRALTLSIPSNYQPWTFPTCKLRPRGDEHGTEYSLIDLEFYAWAFIGNALNAKGTPLFVHKF